MYRLFFSRQNDWCVCPQREVSAGEAALQTRSEQITQREAAVAAQQETLAQAESKVAKQLAALDHREEALLDGFSRLASATEENSAAAKDLETRAAVVGRSEAAVLEKHNELVAKARPDQYFCFQNYIKNDCMDTFISKTCLI